MRSPRAALALVCLALLAYPNASALRPGEIRARLARGQDPGFAFDGGYRSFLEAVRDRTPETATVAIFAPENERYLYEAAYQLAPRRIVARDLSGEARFLAVYRRGPVAVLPAGAAALPGGFLLKR